MGRARHGLSVSPPRKQIATDTAARFVRVWSNSARPDTRADSIDLLGEGESRFMGANVVLVSALEQNVRGAYSKLK